MQCLARLALGSSCALFSLASIVRALPTDRPLLSEAATKVDRVGDVLERVGVPSKVLEDTIWIADWSFDGAGGGCDDTGWSKYDLRILNDGSNYWSIDSRLDGTGSITGNAAILAKHDLYWVRDGYGNGWDYSIILKYQGASTLTFDYLSDTEPGWDYVTVEADSGGASEARVDYTVDPGAAPEDLRTEVFRIDGPQNASITALALPDFGAPTVVHEAYLRVTSDVAYSDQDGLYQSVWNAALIVDNVTVAGGLNYTEDFEDAVNPNVAFANTHPAAPFGEWARLYEHVTDNDQCTENTSCAWLVTDPMRTAFFPDMAFGPGSAVVRNWLDDVIVSPWVSLAGTPSADGTVLSYLRFRGNDFNKGRIVQNWSIRSLVRIDNTDTSSPGDSIDTVSGWAHASLWNSLSDFFWYTAFADMSTPVRTGALQVQLRFRVSDWQYINGVPGPATLNTGPGPYTDRVRIGRRTLNGPVLNTGIDVRSQAQDCFPTYQNAIVPGEHFSPTTDIWGTCAFSQSNDMDWTRESPNLITGDSIGVYVEDVRGAGGITEMLWFGAITAGPHVGKAPAPYTVGANGFFEVVPDSARGVSGSVIDGFWVVDLDDTYFRGGDQLKYFWTSLDASGGRSSSPDGITATSFPPVSVEAAEVATDGLFEVNFLPAINWDPGYLARIQADDHGDLDPTPEEIAGSSQRNCILYYAVGAGAGLGRPSGDTNRTSFMYTLDRLGYRGFYDVYDLQGRGNTNNHLGGRATVPQCSGYALIIQDDGRSTSFSLPDGSDYDSQKIDQVQWYRDYLSQGLTSMVGVANLWLVGEDVAFDNQANALLSTDFGVAQVNTNQGLSVNPNVTGLASFSFANGGTAAFTGDAFSLNGGCPAIRDYDGALSSGSAVVTHRYTSGATTGHGAVIMNKNTTLRWNTVWMGFGWFDIRDATGASPQSGSGSPDVELARKILNTALPLGCVRGESPTNTPGPAEVNALPAVSTLHPNIPNPFNPTTTFAFDLAHGGHVTLRVYDVAGRVVKTLVDRSMPAGWNYRVTWSGLDDGGRRVAGGVYFCRLRTTDTQDVRKVVLLE